MLNKMLLLMLVAGLALSPLPSYGQIAETAGPVFYIDIPGLGRSATHLGRVQAGGLNVRVEGLAGELWARVAAMSVREGRIVATWKSDSFKVLSQSTRLDGGQYLPGDGFFFSSQVSPGDSFISRQPVDAAAAAKAVDVRNFSLFLDQRRATGTTGVILVVIPSCKGKCSSMATSAEFIVTDHDVLP